MASRAAHAWGATVAGRKTARAELMEKLEAYLDAAGPYHEHVPLFHPLRNEARPGDPVEVIEHDVRSIRHKVEDAVRGKIAELGLSEETLALVTAPRLPAAVTGLLSEAHAAALQDQADDALRSQIGDRASGDALLETVDARLAAREEASNAQLYAFNTLEKRLAAVMARRKAAAETRLRAQSSTGT